MTTATAAAAVASATVSTATMPSIATMPSVAVVSMTSIRRSNRFDCGTSATASQVGRVDWPSVTARAESAGVKPLCLFRGVSLILGTTQYMRVVVNHSAEQSMAIGRVLCGVKDVLMPELIQIVLAVLVGPRNEHEAGPSLQQGQKANIFTPGSLSPFKRPVSLFH